jgi:hypothetical protein
MHVQTPVSSDASLGPCHALSVVEEVREGPGEGPDAGAGRSPSAMHAASGNSPPGAHAMTFRQGRVGGRDVSTAAELIATRDRASTSRLESRRDRVLMRRPARALAQGCRPNRAERRGEYCRGYKQRHLRRTAVVCCSNLKECSS